jgi:predicted dehydrogenase
MKKLNFAIVGCGNIAPFHAEGIKNTEGAALIAVCDTDKTKAEKMASEFGAEAYTDYAEMLRNDNVDIVNICLPSGLHKPLSVQAAEAGKHVMVEKPLDITVEKCDAIINACRKNGVKLATIFPSRFKASTLAIKKAITDGRFGRLTLGDAVVKWYRSDEYYASGDWRGTWKFDGGGALMNQSIHYVDLIQDLMGPIESVSAHCSTIVKNIEVEDTAVAIVKFKNGALGTIEGTTTAYPGLESVIAVHGEYGSAIIDGESLVTWQFADELPEDDEIRKKLNITNSSGAADPTKSLSSAGHQLQIEDMVQAVNKDREPMVNGESGKKAVEIIRAIYQSSDNNGKTVFL